MNFKREAWWMLIPGLVAAALIAWALLAPWMKRTFL